MAQCLASRAVEYRVERRTEAFAQKRHAEGECVFKAEPTSPVHQSRGKLRVVGSVGTQQHIKVDQVPKAVTLLRVMEKVRSAMQDLILLREHPPRRR